MRITARQRRLYKSFKVKREKLTTRFKRRSPTIDLRTYARRDNRLRSEGFLDFERYWLNQHKISTKGMIAFRDLRDEFYSRTSHTFKDFNAYRSAISAIYRKKGWTFRDGKSLNPFKWLEAIIIAEGLTDTPQPVRRKAKKHPTKVQREAARHPQALPGHAEFQRQQRLR